MSGHSKWSTIKHKKAANDAVKGSVFTKLARAITVAARTGRGMNLAVEKARAASMPRDNIDRAIAKGMGKGEGEELVELTIEAFAPEGIAVIIEVITDSRNRAVAEIRNLIEKNGGRMGEPGSAMYMFEKLEGGYKPKYTMEVKGDIRVQEFLQIMRENDDVQEVYANLE
ncbi:MAG: hypothetical protein ACD_40C00283G0011 [uncultured bacterium]|nr:MAG: hypothetical protein ACD_40C00283G0011 [uncultured bacterium]KKU25948.1 MAG: DNA-binding regulatory protein, YebC/PmpR family [Microgenomates group bacterium GW2011_GWA2_46_16]